MIDEENKSATMTEAPAATTAAPAHAAPAGSAPVEPEDTVFSLPLSHVTQEYPALVDDEDADTEQLDAPIGAHAAEQRPAREEADPSDLVDVRGRGACNKSALYPVDMRLTAEMHDVANLPKPWQPRHRACHHQIGRAHV